MIGAVAFQTHTRTDHDSPHERAGPAGHVSPREENFPFFPATPPGKTSPKLAFRGSPAMIERRWHDTCSVITDAATGRPTPHPQSFSP